MCLEGNPALHTDLLDLISLWLHVPSLQCSLPVPPLTFPLVYTCRVQQLNPWGTNWVEYSREVSSGNILAQVLHFFELRGPHRGVIDRENNAKGSG